MPLSQVHCACLIGIDAFPVEVEVDISPAEELGLVIVGLPDTAVRESKDRVLTAIKNSGLAIPSARYTVNLAPGDLKKEGPIYDLPIALGLLHCSGLLKETIPLSDYLFIGELALSGAIRHIGGGLAIAMLAKAMGKKGALFPLINAQEASAVREMNIYGVHSLKEAVAFLQGHLSLSPTLPTSSPTVVKTPFIDFADIKGHAYVKRALEVAAAGAHNVVLIGPPGSGKSMLAKSLASILPNMSIEEALEATKAHSAAGLLPEDKGILVIRPFRSPHHTVSQAGLIGGGRCPRPGEVALAHHGILFLDELPEFSRMALESLRQPLEDRKVTIGRANGNLTFPSNFMFIAAMNPCPCGYHGHPERPCKDTPKQVEKYLGKISGPLWDRMDMIIEVPALLHYQDYTQKTSGEASTVIKNRVDEARQWQHARLGKARTNSLLTSKELKEFASLDLTCQEIMRNAVEQKHLSARGHDRTLRVARTIADLGKRKNITPEDLMEAINYRCPL